MLLALFPRYSVVMIIHGSFYDGAIRELLVQVFIDLAPVAG